MNNPILRSRLFATPKDLDDLDQMIRSLNTASERAIAYEYTMFAFNLAHELVEQEKAKANEQIC